MDSSTEKGYWIFSNKLEGAYKGNLWDMKR
jgi:hypothetical protein